MYEANEFMQTVNDVSNRISSPLTPDSSRKFQIVYDGNSLWLQELEVAFLDFTLKQYHNDLHKMIRTSINVSFEIWAFQ